MPDKTKNNNQQVLPVRNTAVDNTKLKEAMQKLAKENTPENINAACEELVMNAKLLVPGSLSKLPLNNNGKTDTQINFQLLITPDKKQWFIAFTDNEEFEKWKKQVNAPDSVNALLLGFNDLNALVQKNEKSSGLMVNPMSSGFTVTREGMQKFKEKKDLRLSAGKDGTVSSINAVVGRTDIDNTSLKQALQKLAEENTQENVNSVIRELVEHSRLIVPGAFSKPPVTDENGRSVLQKDTQVNFQLLVTQDKKQWFIGFTDFEEFEKWAKQSKSENPINTLILSYKDLYGLTQGNNLCSGLVVNPFSAGFMLPKDVMKRLNDPNNANSGAIQAAEKEEQEEMAVAVSDPRVFPERMTDALKRYYKTQKQVKSAYVRMLHHGKESDYLIVIDFEGDGKALFEKTAEIAKPFLGTYGFQAAEYDSDLGKQATEKSEPFYIKPEKKQLFGRRK